MLTNKLNVDLNLNNIDRDFDVLLVNGNDDYGCLSTIIDKASSDYNALSVQYKYGNKVLILFAKGEYIKFKENIQTMYENVTVEKVDLFNDEIRQNIFKNYDLLLIQLLFNSMNNSRNPMLQYNNLTGKLYYNSSSCELKDKVTNKIVYISFLEVILEPGLYLSLPLKTFKRDAKGKYVLDKKMGVFRRKLKSDKDCDTYIEKSYLTKHNTCTFLDITNIKKFNKCKLGVMQKFLEDVDYYLCDYLKINFFESKNAKEYLVSKNKITTNEGRYVDILNKRGVVIVDENKTVGSRLIADKLRADLELFGVDVIESNVLCENAYNIRIIHDKEYYEPKRIIDKHLDDLRGLIVQHVVEEDGKILEESMSDKTPPYLRKIMQELIIKGDIHFGKISIVNWNEFNYDRDWNFVIRKKRTYIAETKQYKYTYYILKIAPSGHISFSVFDDNDPLSLNLEEMNIMSVYEEAAKIGNKINNSIDGLVYQDIDNIHTIYRSCEFTVPNIQSIKEVLDKTNKQFEKDFLLNEISDFYRIHKETYGKQISKWIIEIEKQDSFISNKFLRKLVNLKSTIGRLFSDFIKTRNEDILLADEFRKKVSEFDFKFNNLVELQYEYVVNDFTHKKELHYNVGYTSAIRSYPTACHIRRVCSEGDDIIFEQLFPTMCVDFVRNNQYTVIPFPFKYLREFADKKMIEMENIKKDNI